MKNGLIYWLKIGAGGLHKVDPNSFTPIFVKENILLLNGARCGNIPFQRKIIFSLKIGHGY